nr:serine hydrolase domain-containing protein [Candidatus Sigynarchaeota archaeon]
MTTILDRLDDLDPAIEAAFSKSPIPGLAIGILYDGKLVHEKYLGNASLKNKAPIDATTIFRLASISKTFTTIGILQLWESGKLKLDDPVNAFLPKGKVLVKKGWPEVTFLHLLTHQAGIGEVLRKRDAFKPGFGLLVSGRDTPIPRLSTIHDSNMKTEVPAGSKYSYSNIGFSLLGYIIEQLSGEPFRDYMIKHVLDPVGMTTSDFIPSDRIGTKEAAGYKQVRGRPVPAKYYQNIIMPAGNLYSNISDMARYVSVLLAGGRLPGGGSLLKPATIEMAWTPRYWAHDLLMHEASIGLCFHLYRVNGTRVVEHTGATSGFTSAMSLIPSENAAVLVLSNHDEIFATRSTLQIKHAILEHLLGKSSHGSSSSLTEPAIAKKAAGYYGPLPGLLTNIRIIAYYGGDFKVQNRDGRLFLSTFYGAKHRGVEMIPAETRGVYTITSTKVDDAKPEHVAFIEGTDGKITGLALDFFKLRKNIFINTFRFKVYAIITLIALLGMVVFLLAVLLTLS